MQHKKAGILSQHEATLQSAMQDVAAAEAEANAHKRVHRNAFTHFEGQLAAADPADIAEISSKLEALRLKNVCHEEHQKLLQATQASLKELETEIGLAAVEAELRLIAQARAGSSASGAKFEQF